MSSVQLIYFSKRMLRLLVVNPSGALATFTMLTIFLFMLGVSHTGYEAGQNLLPEWAAHDKAVIYLGPRTSGKDLDELAREIGKWQDIRYVKAMSAQEGMKRLQERMGEWKDFLESIPEESLPPSLEIGLSDRLRTEDEVSPLLTKIRQYPQVEEVLHGNSLVEKLEVFLKPIRLLGVVTTAILGFLALLIIYHSSTIVLHARREELEICGILGATPLFMKAPLYMESVFWGLTSGLVASVCLAFALSWLKNALPIPIAVALPSQGMHAFFLSAELTGCGIVLSLFGRWLAVQRAMKMASPKGDFAGEHA